MGSDDWPEFWEALPMDPSNVTGSNESQTNPESQYCEYSSSEGGKFTVAQCVADMKAVELGQWLKDLHKLTTLNN